MLFLKRLRNFKPVIIASLAFIVSAAVSAIELPTPTTLMAEYSLKALNISVVEPHEPKKDQSVIVNYRALPIPDLLTKWFGDSWRLPGAEIVFFAKDVIAPLLRVTN